MNGNRIINYTATPVNGDDITNKAYVDARDSLLESESIVRDNNLQTQIDGNLSAIQNIEVSGTIRQDSEEFTATLNQTDFTLTSATFAGDNTLAVYINGVRQSHSSYTTFSTDTVIFSEGLQEGDKVLLTVNESVSTTLGVNQIVGHTVNSLEELLSVNPTVSSTVFVKDYHSDVEGGGGVFYWDATKAKSEHNGGTIIDPTAVYPTDWSVTTQQDTWFNLTNAGVGCWVRQYDGAVNVKWFGAKGDGVADDYQSIQFCIDYLNSITGDSKVLVFPVSDYYCSDTLILKRGMSIIAHGATIITGATDVAIQVGVDGSGSFFQGNLDGLACRTDGVCAKGFVYSNVANSVINSTKATGFERNQCMIGGYDGIVSSRVSYNVFENIQSYGGETGLYIEAKALTGYVNENTIIGGRFHDWSIYGAFIGGDSTGSSIATNNMRMIGTSIEGSGTANPAYNVWFAKIDNWYVRQIRTEGTPTNPENCKVFISSDTVGLDFRSYRYDTIVYDGGATQSVIETKANKTFNVFDNQDGFVIKRTTPNTTNTPIYSVSDVYASSGTGDLLAYDSQRWEGEFLKLTNQEGANYTLSHLGGETQVETTGRLTQKRTRSDRSEPVVKITDEYANSGNVNAMHIFCGRGNGNLLTASTAAQNFGGIKASFESAVFESRLHSHFASPLNLGGYRLWVDSSGRLRIKNGAPTSDTDGTVVGTQS
jgi:hypothetical protein